ncbi:MAG TPA: Gfo/Idh/MocA family oxidoreductase [Bacteroidales bacterium]|nr:Gfo/Idh/MocA family oxidoreductase [Bacteroidales bacterium]HPR72048.1 Gfo/Idh/MocA family oxidoreductase [Bacteroidales bacterium]
MTSRRSFLKKAAITSAGIGLVPAFSTTLAGCAPSDRINIGLIGCNGMGFSNLSAFLQNPEVECIALCDIDEEVLNRRASDVEKIRGKRPENLYSDWRRVIDNQDINLVIVGTPDHWHCLQMVAACEAGKDVYCEKPIARTIEECNIMVKAAKKYKSIVQVGQWQRSDPHWLDAVDFIRSGQLGKIRLVRVYSYQGWNTSIPVLPDEPVPEGVDYDMWLGPAPSRPFNRNRFHFTFRWFWDYAGGLMTDWGVHLLDFALFGMDVTTPKSVMAMGGKYGYPDDACETPDSLQVIYEFDGFNVMWDHAIGIDDGGYGKNAVLGFVGENGTLVVDRSGWEVIPEVVNNEKRMEAVPWKAGNNTGLSNHVKNHLECIAKRDPDTNASPDIAAHICKFSAVGNIAFRTGKKLIWDGTRFTNDDEANSYLVPSYREPWKLPQV